jgi:septum formation protein
VTTVGNPPDPRPIVLASTSPYRKAQLARLGLPFHTADPSVDESPFKQRGLPPDQLVAELSRAKARACAAAWPNAVLIGADQCAELDGEILGKPGSVSRAVAQLRRARGRTHRLLTGVCVLDATTSAEMVHVDEHRLTMRALTDAQIRDYVEADQPLDCAGAYKIEALGIALFERIEGCDASAITGLPLMMLTTMLMRVGIDVIDLAGRQRRFSQPGGGWEKRRGGT